MNIIQNNLEQLIIDDIDSFIDACRKLKSDVMYKIYKEDPVKHLNMLVQRALDVAKSKRYNEELYSVKTFIQSINNYDNWLRLDIEYKKNGETINIII
jgi:hypothetical protein